MAHLFRSAAALRIGGDSLIPDEVTRLLGSEPSLSHIKGEQIVGRNTGSIRLAKTGTWQLQAPDREPENLDWQIQEILGAVTDNLGVWAELGERFKIDLFCGLFMEGSDEGLSLSPLTLLALGQRGITLAVCIYGPALPHV